MTLDLTDGERRACKAWLATDEGWRIGAFGHAILKTQAGKMKAEFKLEHYVAKPVKFVVYSICVVCPKDGLDPRHNWTDEQWLEAAKAELSREGKG